MFIILFTFITGSLLIGGCFFLKSFLNKRSKRNFDKTINDIIFAIKNKNFQDFCGTNDDSYNRLMDYSIHTRCNAFLNYALAIMQINIYNHSGKVFNKFFWQGGRLK